MSQFLWVVLIVSSLADRVNAAASGPFRILSAASVNGNEIGVCFSEAVDPKSINAFNYHLSDTNCIVTNVLARRDGHSVVLQLSRAIVGFSFVLMTSDVRSVPGTLVENPIVAGGVFGHDIGGLDNGDIHAMNVKPVQGSVFGCTNGLFARDFEATAGNGRIAESDDSFHYVYHRAYQFFEISVQITEGEILNGTGQAGLMVRESLDSGSRFVAVLINYGSSGLADVNALHRPTERGSSIAWPGSSTFTGIRLPVWLYLRREGSIFTALVGTNGLTATPIGMIEPNPPFATFPETVLAGVATCARGTTSDATARFAYQYRNQPHGDVFPRINIAREQNLLTLRWSNVTVLESSDPRELVLNWTPVTNAVSSGSLGESQWTLDLQRSANARLFRVRFP